MFASFEQLSELRDDGGWWMRAVDMGCSKVLDLEKFPSLFMLVLVKDYDVLPLVYAGSVAFPDQVDPCWTPAQINGTPPPRHHSNAIVTI
jgi:hypothetical protein